MKPTMMQAPEPEYLTALFFTGFVFVVSARATFWLFSTGGHRVSVVWHWLAVLLLACSALAFAWMARLGFIWLLFWLTSHLL